MVVSPSTVVCGGRRELLKSRPVDAGATPAAATASPEVVVGFPALRGRFLVMKG